MDVTRINWKKVVYVKEAPLMLDALALRGQKTSNMIGNNYRVPGQTYLYLDGLIYYADYYIEACQQAVRRNLHALPLMLQRIRTLSDRFAKRDSLFNANQLYRLSTQEILARFRAYLAQYTDMLSTLYPPIAIDHVLSDVVRTWIAKRTSHDQTELFNALTILKKENDSSRYHTTLLRLAASHRVQKRTIDATLQRLAKRYAYLGIKFYYGTPYTFQIVRQHFEQIRRGNPRAELRLRKERQQKERIEYKKALARLKPNHAMLAIIHALQEAIWLRTYRLERLSEGEHCSFVLLNEIGRRIGGVAGKDLIHFRVREIDDALRGRSTITKREIARRVGRFGMFVVSKESGFYFGKDYLRFKKRFHFREKTTTEVHGYIAFPGVVRGKVRLIKEDKDLSTMRRGEILVARMTTPDYVFAMKKAAAIVTDVGGVTSHASVVSRELGIPCIIGTENATSVFKNSDRVEVDATKGIVRKI